MKSNITPLVNDLSEIEKQVKELSDQAHAIMHNNREAFAGALVETWDKRRFRILNLIEHRGVVTAYGRVERKDGKVPTNPRGYSIGRITRLRFLEETNGQENELRKPDAESGL